MAYRDYNITVDYIMTGGRKITSKKYDFKSIMHYKLGERMSLSSSSKEKLSDQKIRKIGQRKYLSALDEKLINDRFPIPPILERKVAKKSKKACKAKKSKKARKACKAKKSKKAKKAKKARKAPKRSKAPKRKQAKKAKKAAKKTVRRSKRVARKSRK